MYEPDTLWGSTVTQWVVRLKRGFSIPGGSRTHLFASPAIITIDTASGAGWLPTSSAICEKHCVDMQINVGFAKPGAYDSVLL